MGNMCPLLSKPDADDKKDQQWECYYDTCAWYVNGKCAVVLIAEKLSEES